MQADSYSYDTIAVNITDGHGYVNKDLVPTMEREPAYPFFLAGVYSIFGHYYLPVQLIQIMLFLAMVILVYKITKLIFDEKTALYSMTITGFFPTLLNYPAYILSETLFIFLLSLSIFSCVKVYFKGGILCYILAGFALAASTLCKCIMLPFIIIVISALILLKCNKREACREIGKIIVMLLVYIAAVGPWIYRNYVNFGSFAIRDGSEIALAVKAQKLNYNKTDFKQNLVFTISEGLGGKFFSDAGKPEDFLFKEDALVREQILPGLRDKGYSDKEIKAIMVSKIMKRPFKFLTISLLDLFKMTQFTYLPVLIDQEYLIVKMVNIRHGDFYLSALRGIFRFLSYILILFSVCGMLIRKDKWKGWIFLFLLIIYINFAYTIIYGHGRYGVPLIPYYIILSSPVFVAMKKMA
jgi:4-amino-4-deoxy-L-arabinose transferase-like glycosyltransferase